MINNRIDGELPDATVAYVLQLLKQATESIPFMISLTPPERKSLQSVSDGRLPYVQKCEEYCVAQRVKIGMSVEDLQELTHYADLFKALSQIFHVADGLRSSLRDTYMQVGAILYRQCRAGHQLMEIAYGKGRPGLEPMIDDLDRLFENQGKSSNDDESKDDGPANGTQVAPAA